MHSGRKRNVLLILALFSMVMGALIISPGGALKRTVMAQPVSPAQRESANLISLDFDNADIRVVIKHISEITGRNFLVDEKVRGNVTIITPAKIRMRDVYQVLLSLLHTYGFAVVPSGKVMKIVPLREASRSGVPTFSLEKYKGLLTSDRIVTAFIHLAHADASALAGLLRPLAAREGNLAAYRPANALILTDTEANVRRLMSIIKSVDIPAAVSEVVVVRMKFALASEMADTLKELIKETRQGSIPVRRRPATRRGRPSLTSAGGFVPKKEVKIIPDERINAIIFVAPKSEILRLRSLVKKLDIPPLPDRKRIHVYRLKHSLAEELAKVLNQQIDTKDKVSGAKSSGSRRGSRNTRNRSRRRVRPSTPAIPGKNTEQGTGLLSDVVITPDRSTNSLIVRASPRDYNSLIEIIEKLDVRRSQVLVEVLIAEMTLEKARDLGFEWRIFNSVKGGSLQSIGGTNLPIGASSQGIINQFAAAPFAGPTGLVLGAVRGSLTFGNQSFLNLRGLIRAFESDSEINILSTPQILTLDNEEAEIIVGENRPFVTQSQTTSDGSTIQNFEFKDIGVILRITPHISPNRFVQLKLFQEILNFVEESQVGAVVTTKRQATTTVSVEDGQTVVIGGLIRDDTKDLEVKVPFLGDIPILGALFKTTRKTKIKTNLLIFITPRIVTSPAEHQRLTEFKKGETENLIKPKVKSIKERM